MLYITKITLIPVPFLISVRHKLNPLIIIGGALERRDETRSPEMKDEMNLDGLPHELWRIIMGHVRSPARNLIRSVHTSFRGLVDATTTHARWKLCAGPECVPELPSLRDLEVPILSADYVPLLENVATRITSLTINSSNMSVNWECQIAGVSSTDIADLICSIGPQLRRLDVARTVRMFGTSDVERIVTRFPCLDALHVYAGARSTVHIARLTALQHLELHTTVEDDPEHGTADLNISHLAALTMLRTLDLRHFGNYVVRGSDALAALTGLEALTIKDVVLDDAAALAHLSRLTQLTIEYGNTDDISVVSSIVSLRKLTLSNTDRYRSTPITMPGSTLVNLEELNLDNCAFTTSEPLAQLTGLKKLCAKQADLVGRPFHNADTDAAVFLPHMRCMRDLTCGLRCHGLPNLESMASTLTKAKLYIKHVVDLSPLSCLTQLDELGIYAPQTTTLQPLTTLTRLSKLSVVSSAVSAVAPLLRLRSTLKSLYVYSLRDVHDWAALAYMTNLTQLKVYNSTIKYDALAIKASLERCNLQRFVYRDDQPLDWRSDAMPLLVPEA
jgi:hypothetical protein